MQRSSLSRGSQGAGGAHHHDSQEAQCSWTAPGDAVQEHCASRSMRQLRTLSGCLSVFVTCCLSVGLSWEEFQLHGLEHGFWKKSGTSTCITSMLQKIMMIRFYMMHVTAACRSWYGQSFVSWIKTSPNKNFR